MVKKKIKPYSYTREDGKRINVRKHERTYHTRAREKDVIDMDRLKQNIERDIKKSKGHSEEFLETLSKQAEEIILKSNFDEDIIDELPSGGYLYHGTSSPLDVLESEAFKRTESIDEEGAIFFTVNLKEALSYGTSVIAIPIEELKDYEVYRNIHGNHQELTTLMIEDDIPVPESTLVYERNNWYGQKEYLTAKSEDDWYEYASLEDSEKIKKIVNQLNSNERAKWDNLTIPSKEIISQLEKQLEVLTEKGMEDAFGLSYLIKKEKEKIS